MTKRATNRETQRITMSRDVLHSLRCIFVAKTTHLWARREGVVARPISAGERTAWPAGSGLGETRLHSLASCSLVATSSDADEPLDGSRIGEAAMKCPVATGGRPRLEEVWAKETGYQRRPLTVLGDESAYRRRIHPSVRPFHRPRRIRSTMGISAPRYVNSYRNFRDPLTGNS